MCKSNIQGETGANAVVVLESSKICEKLHANQITACKMPPDERQPDLNWLIQMELEELTDDSTDLIIRAERIYCASGTDSGRAEYQFSDVKFLGARNNVVKFGALGLDLTVKSH